MDSGKFGGRVLQQWFADRLVHLPAKLRFALLALQPAASANTAMHPTTVERTSEVKRRAIHDGSLSPGQES